MDAIAKKKKKKKMMLNRMWMDGQTNIGQSIDPKMMIDWTDDGFPPPPILGFETEQTMITFNIELNTLHLVVGWLLFKWEPALACEKGISLLFSPTDQIPSRFKDRNPPSPITHNTNPKKKKQKEEPQ